MKKILITILVGCVLIGVGIGVFAFELTQYEFVRYQAEDYRHVQSFEVDATKPFRLVTHGYVNYEIITDDTLDKEAKIRIYHNGNSENAFRMEREVTEDSYYYEYDSDYDDETGENNAGNHSSGEKQERVIRYEFYRTSYQQGNYFGEVLRDLKDHKIYIDKYESGSYVKVYINSKYRNNIVGNW